MYVKLMYTKVHLLNLPSKFTKWVKFVCASKEGNALAYE